MIYQVLVHALGLHWGLVTAFMGASCKGEEMGVKKIHMMTIMQKKERKNGEGEFPG